MPDFAIGTVTFSTEGIGVSRGGLSGANGVQVTVSISVNEGRILGSLDNNRQQTRFHKFRHSQLPSPPYSAEPAITIVENHSGQTIQAGTNRTFVQFNAPYSQNVWFGYNARYVTARTPPTTHEIWFSGVLNGDVVTFANGILVDRDIELLDDYIRNSALVFVGENTPPRFEPTDMLPDFPRARGTYGDVGFVSITGDQLVIEVPDAPFPNLATKSELEFGFLRGDTVVETLGRVDISDSYGSQKTVTVPFGRADCVGVARVNTMVFFNEQRTAWRKLCKTSTALEPGLKPVGVNDRTPGVNVLGLSVYDTVNDSLPDIDAGRCDM